MDNCPTCDIKCHHFEAGPGEVNLRTPFCKAVGEPRDISGFTRCPWEEKQAPVRTNFDQLWDYVDSAGFKGAVVEYRKLDFSRKLKTLGFEEKPEE